MLEGNIRQDLIVSRWSGTDVMFHLSSNEKDFFLFSTEFSFSHPFCILELTGAVAGINREFLLYSKTSASSNEDKGYHWGVRSLKHDAHHQRLDNRVILRRIQIRLNGWLQYLKQTWDQLSFGSFNFSQKPIWCIKDGPRMSSAFVPLVQAVEWSTDWILLDPDCLSVMFIKRLLVDRDSTKVLTLSPFLTQMAFRQMNTRSCLITEHWGLQQETIYISQTLA